MPVTQIMFLRHFIKTSYRIIFLAAALIPVASRAAESAPVRIVVIGDSTVSEYPESRPDRGWGQFIEEQFKEGAVEVVNLAKPGRSTKTFIEEGLWQQALEEKPGYVLIQFGHNDSHDPNNPESTDPATDYRTYLQQYIEESRAIGATPILVTPMVRRTFDADGKIAKANTPPNRPLSSYAAAMKEVASEMDTPVIDLFASSKELVEALGLAESAKLANKDGDPTHFNEKGARAMAALVMDELPSAAPELKKLLAKPNLSAIADPTNDPDSNALPAGQFSNPILSGDYPDPSLLRDGDEYYLTHSSFDCYPGLLIWHSNDLVNWKPVTRALHENVGSVWAPDFIKYQDTYYIYFPASGKNWVVTASDPAGPWSDPVPLNVPHIDPGHVATPDGERYVHFNGGNAAPLSEDGLRIQEDLGRVYDGWEIPDDMNIACFCLEGPKLFYKPPYYYLTSAQGGTVGPATAHMAVSARSLSPIGPWEDSPYNPIVHTYSKDETWHAKGHGTVFDDQNGNWWIVYHAYLKDYYTLGRQTLLEPIEWATDGWFKVPADSRTDQPIAGPSAEAQRNRIELSDTFSGSELGLQWSFYKDFDSNRFQLQEGALRLSGEGDSPGDSFPMLCHPQDESYEISVEYELEGDAQAAIVLFYSPDAYAGLATDGNRFTIYRRAQPLGAGANPRGRVGFLKIRNVEHETTFYHSGDGQNWNKIQRSFVVGGYEHRNFGGFVSLKAGLTAMGEGSVKYRSFEYSRLKSP